MTPKLILVSPEMIQQAKLKAEALGTLNNSITDGDGNVAGYVGQAAVAKYFGVPEAETFEWDLLAPNGMRVEVKTKRQIDFPPQPNWACSVCDKNAHQQCDIYCFVRVTHDYRKAWICGFISPKRFKLYAIFWKKGWFDPDNDMVIKEDCWSVPVSELMDWETICQKLIAIGNSPS